MGELRSIAPSFVASGPNGVAVRTRLKQLAPGDEKVLCLVGEHLGSLASKDLKTRAGTAYRIPVRRGRCVSGS